MTLWIREDLRATFAGLSFDDILALGEHVVRVGPGGARRTARFERGGRRFYLKVHTGVGWREICKSWLQGKRAIVDARPEARALARLAELGIPAPVLAGFGARGLDPARRRSFVITESLEGTQDLARLLAGEPAPAPRLRRELARELGRIARRLHGARIAHQDFYLEHVHVLRGADGSCALFLIDLHRALPARAGSRRWLRKDLAALRFSSLSLPVTRTDCARFLRAYRGGALAREARARERAELRRIEERAHAIGARLRRRFPRGR